jgi:hypothetical protein
MPTSIHTDARPMHPASQVCPRSLLTVSAIVFTLATLFGLTGCAMYQHGDGNGYTVRYAAEQHFPDGKVPVRQTSLSAPANPVTPKSRVTKIVVVDKSAVDNADPILNRDKDDQIPREFANYVSERSLATFSQRSKMCAQTAAGYCLKPNVSHCHGPFCHAHIGGDKRHTHSIATKNN